MRISFERNSSQTRRLRDEAGATAIGLVAVLITVAALGAFRVLAPNLTSNFNSVVAQLWDTRQR